MQNSDLEQPSANSPQNEAKPPEKKDMPIWKVILLTLLGQLFYTTTAVLSKDMLNNRGVTVMEFSFICSCFNLISAIFMVKVNFKMSFYSSVPRKDACTVVFRSFAGVICFLTITAAPKFLPISVF